MCVLGSLRGIFLCTASCHEIHHAIFFKKTVACISSLTIVPDLSDSPVFLGIKTTPPLISPNSTASYQSETFWDQRGIKLSMGVWCWAALVQCH